MNDNSPFKPFTTVKASEIVYTHIKNRILAGDFAAGEKIPSENQLAEIFGKSRPTIREALRMLESNQYITIQRGKGATVNPITTYTIERTLEDLISNDTIERSDVAFVRNICETLAASLAAERRADSDIAELNEIMESSGKIEIYKDLLPFNEKFHQTVSRASGNGMLLLVNDMTYPLLNEMYSRYFKSLSMDENKAECQKVVREHQLILDAIIAQDSDAAKEAMRRHLLTAAITM